MFYVSLSMAATVSGNVRDIRTGKSIENVSIYFNELKTGTVSDRDGYFDIVTPESGKDTLYVEMIGYKRLTIPLRFPVKYVLNVEMETEVLSYGEQVTVTAVRIPKSLWDNSVSMDLIEQEQIQNASARHIADLLEPVRSLLVRDYGGAGNMKTLSLRGASAGQVLFLQDGRRMNDPQNGEVDLSLIPVNHLERVEIVRGGSSAIYGADAVGGVINLITRKPSAKEPLRISLRSSLGSFRTSGIESDISGQLGKIGFLASYHFLSSEGNYNYTDNLGETQIRDNNDVLRHQIYTSLYYGGSDPVRGPEIRMDYSYLDSERGSPGTVGFYYHYARMRDKQHNVSANMSLKSNNLRHTMHARVYFSDHFNHYLNEDPLSPFMNADDQYTTRALGSEVRMESRFSPFIKLHYGIGVRADQLLQLEVERVSYYAFLADESIFFFENPLIRSLRVSPSIRFNGNSDFSDQLTPKIGILLKTGKILSFDLMANTGLSYRAPTFNDLYWPADAFTSGNPDLLPEKGFDWDAGFRIGIKGISIESMYFNNHYKDLIAWAPSEGIWRPENISQAAVQGIENSLRVDIIPGHLSLSSNYTWLHSRNLSEDEGQYNKQLMYRPEHSANLVLQVSLAGFSLHYTGRLTGKRYSDNYNTEDTALPAHAVSDISLRYGHHIRELGLNYDLKIRNIFDTPYSIMADLPMPGREYLFSLMLMFNAK